MKSEVRRGRKFVEYHDPETQDEFTFTQEISGADVSYQETDGSWHPADENWQTDGLDGFILKNDKLNHKVRLKGTGGRTWYPRRNVNTEYMTFGVPQYRNGNKWSNFSFSGWSVEGKTITLNTRQGVTILVHNRWNGIKIDWVLNNATAPSRMRYPVSLTGITYVDGIIYGADGERLGQLMPTTATDANEAELACSGSYANGYVEFQADVTGAVYPVTIDPDFTTPSGGSSELLGTDATYSTARATCNFLNNTGSYRIRLGQNKWGASNYEIYRNSIKFDTSSIGTGNVVTQVNLKLYLWVYNPATDFDVQVVKCDWSSYDPVTSSNKDTVYDLILSSDLDAVWLNTSVLSGTGYETGGNLTTTWVNRSGTTYYGLRSKLDADNTAPTADDTIVIGGNLAGGEQPKLSVTYTAAATGALRRTNMNAQMSNLTGGMHG